MNIHKHCCTKAIDEQCALPYKKSTKDKKLQSFLGKIKPEDRDNKRKSSQITGINGMYFSDICLPKFF